MSGSSVRYYALTDGEAELSGDSGLIREIETESAYGVEYFDGDEWILNQDLFRYMWDESGARAITEEQALALAGEIQKRLSGKTSGELIFAFPSWAEESSEKANPYHDKLGRFTHGPGGVGMSPKEGDQLGFFAKNTPKRKFAVDLPPLFSPSTEEEFPGARVVANYRRRLTEVETPSELQNLVKMRYPEKHIALENSDPARMGKAMVRYDELVQRYPQVNREIQSITVESPSNDTIFAWANGRTKTLSFSSTFFGTEAKNRTDPETSFEAIHDSAVKRGWLSNGSGRKVEDVVTHEFGHHVQFHLQRQSGDSFVKYVPGSGDGLVQTMVNRLSDKPATQKLSMYATKAEYEAFAEGFVNYEARKAGLRSGRMTSYERSQTKLLDAYYGGERTIYRRYTPDSWSYVSSLREKLRIESKGGTYRDSQLIEAATREALALSKEWGLEG